MAHAPPPEDLDRWLPVDDGSVLTLPPEDDLSEEEVERIEQIHERRVRPWVGRVVRYRRLRDEWRGDLKQAQDFLTAARGELDGADATLDRPSYQIERCLEALRRPVGVEHDTGVPWAFTEESIAEFGRCWRELDVWRAKLRSPARDQASAGSSSTGGNMMTASQSPAAGTVSLRDQIDRAYGAASDLLRTLGALAHRARNWDARTTPNRWADLGGTYASALIAWHDLVKLSSPAVIDAARRVYPPGSASIRFGKARASSSVLEVLADALGVQLRNTMYQQRPTPLDDTAAMTEGDALVLLAEEWKKQDPEEVPRRMRLLRFASIDLDDVEVQLHREALAALPPHAESSAPLSSVLGAGPWTQEKGQVTWKPGTPAPVEGSQAGGVPTATPAGRLRTALFSLGSNLRMERPSLVTIVADRVAERVRWVAQATKILNSGDERGHAALLGRFGLKSLDGSNLHRVMYNPLTPEGRPDLFGVLDQAVATGNAALAALTEGGAAGLDHASANAMTPATLGADLREMRRLLVSFREALQQPAVLPESTPRRLAALGEQFTRAADILLSASSISHPEAAGGLNASSKDEWFSSSTLKDRCGLTPDQLQKAATRGNLHPEKRGKLLWYRGSEVRKVYPIETRDL